MVMISRLSSAPLAYMRSSGTAKLSHARCSQSANDPGEVVRRASHDDEGTTGSSAGHCPGAIPGLSSMTGVAVSHVEAGYVAEGGGIVP